MSRLPPPRARSDTTSIQEMLNNLTDTGGAMLESLHSDALLMQINWWSSAIIMRGSGYSSPHRQGVCLFAVDSYETARVSLISIRKSG